MLLRRGERLPLLSMLHGRNFLMQRAASLAFLIRVANAALAYISQILMARWMGAFEFGIYVYVWTWVLLIGTVADLGFAVAAQHFIPRYASKSEFGLVRGFISTTRWAPTLVVTLLAAAAAALITLFTGRLDAYLVVPLYLACLALPPYGLTAAQDGVARSFGWINLALAPPFVLRPLLLLGVLLLLFATGFPPDATTAVYALILATWITSIGQMAVLDRRLAVRLPKAQKAYSYRNWFAYALPILFANVFLFLIGNVGVLVLQHFRSPDEIAVYFAAMKVTAIVAMIFFAVSASAAHRFSQYEAANDREGLSRFYASSIRSMFWPSLAAGIGLLICGKPLLWLFGTEFTEGYALLFVLIAGLLVRAAVGPGGLLLDMVGQQRICAAIYAVAFAFNLALCLMLIPRWGGIGAATAASASIVLESVLLFMTVRSRLGIHLFIWQPGGNRFPEPPAKEN